MPCIVPGAHTQVKTFAPLDNSLPGPRKEAPGTVAMGTLPWVLIPAFLVPLFLLTHLAIAVRPWAP